MIIGHLPAGYLAARALYRHFDEDPLIWWCILIGAVLPDLDMLWFVFVDGGTVHHHSYITHDPTLWLSLLIPAFIFASRPLLGLGIGGTLHMMLDTIVGPIQWGFGRLSFQGPLIEVPATQDWWVWSFVLHWTFIGEIILVTWALVVLVKRQMRRHRTP